MPKVRTRPDRGFTLIEAAIALLVLAIGALGTYGLVKNSVETGRQIDSKTDALMLLSRFSAEVQNARLLSAGDRDPHLVAGSYDELTTHVTASPIQTFGYLSRDLGPVSVSMLPAYRLAYEVQACAACGALGGVEILVTISNVNPSGALVRPQQYVIRREHNQSMAGGTPRGY
ncbi:MAG: prepilin-type N-terminal cleavage/methylation domain-containing protein [Deltaproteobacteria bacterium]|nr:prepilin-type N-terminal cleavage/methylation domain-containing protein [Deltaproteobacteria bacterium]